MSATPIKSTFAASGYSDEFNTRDSVVYYADFTTGEATGSAQLEVKLSGDWIPADAEVTGTMDAVEVVEAAGVGLTYRWRVTRSGGTIYTYLA